MKLLLTLILTVTLIGCSQKQEVVTLKIIDIQPETAWGCIDADWGTIVEVKELGIRAKLCGKKGVIGDEFKGCWVTGSFDPMNDGVRSYCNNPTIKGE